jgi:hypothetical protein
VIIRLCCIATLVVACAGSPESEGVSRVGAALAQPGASGPLEAAVSEAMLVAEPTKGAPWRAFLSADGSARRMGDGAPGRWQVDGGRLCTSFADGRSCWWVVRDGSSEPAFRGDRPGERARLARASPEL